MKIFIIGLSQSGKDKIASALTEDPRLHYISATDWLASTFRPSRPTEKVEEYEQAYHDYYISRLKDDQDMVIDNLFKSMQAVDSDHFLIDGINNPADFTYFFNP